MAGHASLIQGAAMGLQTPAQHTKVRACISALLQSKVQHCSASWIHLHAASAKPTKHTALNNTKARSMLCLFCAEQSVYADIEQR
jgi:hypothetical protein